MSGKVNKYMVETPWGSALIIDREEDNKSENSKPWDCSTLNCKNCINYSRCDFRDEAERE